MPLVVLTRQRTFDPTSGEVVTGRAKTRLEPQPAALLTLLADRAGRLVTHDEIRARLWADGRHVDYAASVHYAVRQVRRALDDGDGGTDIEALPRRGYRLRLDALAPDEPATAAVDDAVVSARRVRLRWVAAAAVAAALVAFIERQPNDHHAVAVALVQAVHDAIY